MRVIYIDCSNGISSDMVLSALLEAGADSSFVDAEKEKIHRAIHGEDHGHAHRGYRQIMGLIDAAGLAEGTRQYLTDIYTVIAKAEAEVHGEDLDTVHFHEVGRDEALLNLTGTAAAAASFGPDSIICSPVHDGHGTIKCSHGIIPVPVPAVEAMKKYCDYIFVQDDVETEMVTPSGLGILIGLGAVRGEKPEGTPVSKGEGKGSRDIGRTEGLKVSIYE